MSNIGKLLGIMARLREPDGGCPWDVEQDFKSIAPCTLEEAYEVVDAIERGDMANLKEELGDLLLQVVFHSQMAKEENIFTFDDVVEGISQKMVDRHPHVFGDADIKTSDEQMASWEKIKAAEKAAKGMTGILDDVPVGMPANQRATKILKKAAKVGFDWPSVEPVFDKLQEEIGELKQAMKSGDANKITDEMGDVLFVMMNIARHLKVDPDTALRATMRKFENRFRFIEDGLRKQKKEFVDMSLEQLDELWDEAKKLEKI